MEGTRTAQACLESLQKTATMLSEVFQESEIVRILLNQVTCALACHKALVLLVTGGGDELMVAGAAGLSETYLAKMGGRVIGTPVNERALDGELVVMADVTRDPAFPRALAEEEHLRSLVALPLSVRGRAIGVLHLYPDAVVEQGAEELVLLSALANLGALALEKLRLSQSLYRIAEALSSSLELEPMLRQVLQATVDGMWLRAGSIRLVEPKDQTLYLVAAYGLSKAYLDKGEEHLTKSEIDRRVLQGEAVVLHDVEHDSGFEYPEAAAREGIRSILVVPLKVKDRTFGLMRVHSGRPRHFGPVAITFLRSVADLVSLAIENAELYGALKAKYKELKLDLADWHRFLALG
jgi:GAF domain-containing protein